MKTGNVAQHIQYWQNTMYAEFFACREQLF